MVPWALAFLSARRVEELILLLYELGMKSYECRRSDDDGRPRGAPWTKNGRQKSQIETVKRREIGCPFSGAAYR